jgi:hypothetical protein
MDTKATFTSRGVFWGEFFGRVLSRGFRSSCWSDAAFAWLLLLPWLLLLLVAWLVVLLLACSRCCFESLDWFPPFPVSDASIFQF